MNKRQAKQFKQFFRVWIDFAKSLIPLFLWLYKYAFYLTLWAFIVAFLNLWGFGFPALVSIGRAEFYFSLAAFFMIFVSLKIVIWLLFDFKPNIKFPLYKNIIGVKA